MKNIYKIIKGLGIGILFLFVVNQLNAQSIVIDNQYNSMSFTNAQKTIITNNGNDGKSVGSVHRYDNVTTIGSHTIYALLTILEMDNIEIRNFDDDNITGEQHRFQPRLGNTSGGNHNSGEDGHILYQLEFFDTNTDYPVFLYHYWLSGVDIDGDNNVREYNEVGGYSSYLIDATNQLTISTNPLTGRTRFKGIDYSLAGVTFENKASYMAKFENPNNKITFVLGITKRYTERYFSVQMGAKRGEFPNPVPVNNPLPVAVDDYGTIITSTTGGITVDNILDNDLYDGDPVVPSEVTVSVITPASNSGVELNTNTGEVTVAAGTPAGDYTIVYKLCMVSNPDDCDLATIYVTVIDPEADLSLEKTASPNPVLAGNDITFTISVTNNGPNTAENVVVEDALPSNVIYKSSNPSVGSWSAPNWTIGNLANGASATLTIVATVKSGASGTIENTATVSSDTPDPDSENNTDTSTTTINQPSADLAIVKTATPNPAMANQTVTFTLTVTNNGPNDAKDVVVTDVLPNDVSFINENKTTGSWVSPDWTIGDLANGESATLTIETIVKENITENFTNTATVTGSVPDPDSENNTSTVTVEIKEEPILINYFPAGGFGTLAFEDLWPGKGDYDFNDLILDYQFKIKGNTSNYIEKVEATFIIKAFGAGLENGFGFQLSQTIDASTLQVSGYELTENFISLNPNGTESGQDKPTIIVYDNAYNQMEHPGVGIGVNTDPNAPYVTPDTLSILITFPINTYTLSDLDIGNFNPFLIVDLTRGHEVHLPNYPATSLAEPNLFNTFDDTTNPATNRYYKTSTNLPWAINIYESFEYPIEKREISTAYTHFIEWAESGGTLFPDWYMNKPGYRVTTNIYSKNP